MPLPDGHAHACDDTCVHSNDGECDDGGDGSLFSLCDHASDCGDCGHRVVPVLPPPPPFTATTEEGLRFTLAKADHECASADVRLGDYGELAHCAAACGRLFGCKFFLYGKGRKAGSCWAEFASDSTCPEGWEPDQYDFFALNLASPPPPQASPPSGAPSLPPSPPQSPGACSNSCYHSSDGECDDGGAGSQYSLCELGTDCADCGVRLELPPPPPMPMPPPSPPPPAIASIWLHTFAEAVIDATAGLVYSAVAQICSHRAPASIARSFSARYSPDTALALPISVQQLLTYTVYFSPRIELSDVEAAVHAEMCPGDTGVARECEVMSVLSGRPSTSDDAMQLAHVGLRRSLHGDETFDIKQLNKTSLLASLRAVQLSNAADDVAAHECPECAEGLAADAEDYLADASELVLGSAPSQQEVLLKLNVAGWPITPEDVAAIVPAFAGPLNVSPLLVSAEVVHASESSPSPPTQQERASAREGEAVPPVLILEVVAAAGFLVVVGVIALLFCRRRAGEEGAAKEAAPEEGGPAAFDWAGRPLKPASKKAARSSLISKPSRIAVRATIDPSVAAGNRNPKALDRARMSRKSSLPVIIDHPVTELSTVSAGAEPSGGASSSSVPANPFLQPAEPPAPPPPVVREMTPAPASRGLAAADGEVEVSNRNEMYDALDIPPVLSPSDRVSPDDDIQVAVVQV